MLFSEHFAIPNPARADWFDPVLIHDTKLFVDPFLIFRTRHAFFAGAHQEIVAFFDRAFHLAGKSAGNRNHPAFRKLESMLLFPEADELCLGYTARGVAGAGAGRGFSSVIAAGILQSIAAGLTHVSHFEEIALLNEGIGPDRISDITANILKWRLIKYTQHACRRYKVRSSSVRIRNARFDTRFGQWQSAVRRLPVNPRNGRPVLLVPKRFLRHLSTISPDAFLDFAFDRHPDTLRNDLNFEIKSRVKKSEIIDLAKNHRFMVREYMQEVDGKVRPTPYDLNDDPSGLYRWASETSRFVRTHPVALDATGADSFNAAVEAMIQQYRHFVEQNAGYKLLWDQRGSRPKTEEATQLLFLGVVANYCRANNIDVTREADIGRGPVDFKFSSGYSSRALLEVKLARNSKFWRNLKNQLPTYLRAERITRGYYLIVTFDDLDHEKALRIRRVLRHVSRTTGRAITHFIVDASGEQPSASNV